MPTREQIISEFMAERGRKGARSLAKKLGKKGRKARAQTAAQARWSKKGGKK